MPDLWLPLRVADWANNHDACGYRDCLNTFLWNPAAFFDVQGKKMQTGTRESAYTLISDSVTFLIFVKIFYVCIYGCSEQWIVNQMSQV